MTYKYDPDLEFLQNCSQEQLDTLTSILQLNYNEEKLWLNASEKMQSLGKENLKDIFLNGRILYKDILIDVCKKLKTDFNPNYPTEKIEKKLIEKVKKEPLLFNDLNLEYYRVIIPSTIEISLLREKSKINMNI